MSKQVDSDSRAPTEEPCPDRRRFFGTLARFGFTTACLAGSSMALASCSRTKKIASREEQRRKTAEHIMNIATGYVLGASRSYPIMQLDFKENIQNMTKGRIYVKLLPAGQLGTGSAAVQKVQTGTLQAAQHSLANFAPFAPAVDLVNIPYWCGTNQEFVNLVTSEAWKRRVHPMVEAKGFKPLWYATIDPRVVALRLGAAAPARTPRDMAGIKFRVSGSKVLAQFYRLLGANPTPIAWAETPSALKQGVADALDCSIEALYVCGCQDILSWITFNRPVPDAQVYSCNAKWLDSLPKQLRHGVLEASEVTFRQNLAKVPSARAYAMAELERAGIRFYTPSADEMQEWVQTAGHQREAWEPFKRELGGSLAVFDELLQAANTPSSYYVHDLL